MTRPNSSGLILAIESSCDETAVCIMRNYEVLSHKIYSQVNEHKKFNGVVPQIASDLHMKHLKQLIEECLIEAKCDLKEIDGFAATMGPGLINSLMIGGVYAKMLAGMCNKPFIAINHLEAHVLSPLISNPEIEMPYLMLLISGGHSQFVIAKGIGNYEVLGSTVDDAVGECFDKVARLLGFSYPGGPEIEKIAQYGDKNKFVFPIAMKDNTCNMSFSGIKTFTMNLVNQLNKSGAIVKSSLMPESSSIVESSIIPEPSLSLNNLSMPEPSSIVESSIISEPSSSLSGSSMPEPSSRLISSKIPTEMLADLAASFQKGIGDNLSYKLNIALKKYISLGYNNRQFVIAGGVAANQYLVSQLGSLAKTYGFSTYSPPLYLCTDNGIMVCYAASKYYEYGINHNLNFSPKSKWSLSSLPHIT